jgi:hypothetical protein
MHFVRGIILRYARVLGFQRSQDLSNTNCKGQAFVCQGLINHVFIIGYNIFHFFSIPFLIIPPICWQIFVFCSSFCSHQDIQMNVSRKLVYRDYLAPFLTHNLTAINHNVNIYYIIFLRVHYFWLLIQLWNMFLPYLSPLFIKQSPNATSVFRSMTQLKSTLEH